MSFDPLSPCGHASCRDADGHFESCAYTEHSPKCLLCGQTSKQFAQPMVTFGAGYAHDGCAADYAWGQIKDDPERYDEYRRSQ